MITHAEIVEKSMEHWRKCYGKGSTFPFSGNALMIEIDMKEFFEEGFRQGMEFAKNVQGEKINGKA